MAKKYGGGKQNGSGGTLGPLPAAPSRAGSQFLIWFSLGRVDLQSTSPDISLSLRSSVSKPAGVPEGLNLVPLPGSAWHCAYTKVASSSPAVSGA